MTVPNGPTRHEAMLKIAFALLLLAMSQSAMKASETPLQPEEIDSLLGSKTEFSRQEVAELMGNVLTDAEDEIERTAQEAAREVAAEDAGEIAAQKSIAESWKKEAEKLNRENGFWRKSAILEAAVIAGGALVFALTH